MSTIKNTDYLKFNAESMKKFIIKKLSENQYFTDQVFEDSNLSILIDVFAYMFETMMFNLNNSASESVFSDTQLYENMNRIVKLLGYNPNGFITSDCQCNFYTLSALKKEEGEDALKAIFIPKYTYITVDNKKDSNGNDITYALIEDKQIQTVNGILEKEKDDSEDNQIIMYNGKWKLYDRTFVSTGIPYESYELNIPNSTTILAHPHVDIYIKRDGAFIYFYPVSQGTLFGNGGSSIFSPIDNVFELRLNEYQKYVITFGDGIHGSSLKSGDEIYIIYLKSNGIDANITTSQIKDIKLQFSIDGLDLETVYVMLAGDRESFLNQYYVESEFNAIGSKILCENITPATLSQPTETVEDIRTNAPIWFRQLGKLITEQDFEYFMKKNYMGLVYDCKVMNNWKYATSFLRWLYLNGKLDENIKKEYYKYSDSCDFNNVYLWTKFKVDIENYEFIENALFATKCLTCEPIILKAVDLVLIPCVNIQDSNGVSYNTAGFNSSKIGIIEQTFDNEYANFIEVLRSKSSIIPHEKIKQNVKKAIIDFFNPEYWDVGSTIDLSKLFNILISIDGVQDIKMGYLKPGVAPSNTIYYNGLSFAAWSKRIMNGKDFEIFKGSKKIEEFQFPVLAEDTILNLDKRIIVVSESFSSPMIEY